MDLCFRPLSIHLVARLFKSALMVSARLAQACSVSARREEVTINLISRNVRAVYRSEEGFVPEKALSESAD